MLAFRTSLLALGIVTVGCAAPASTESVGTDDAPITSVDEVCGLPALAPRGALAAVNVCGGSTQRVAVADLRTSGTTKTVAEVVASDLRATGDVFAYATRSDGRMTMHVHGWDGAERATIPFRAGEWSYRRTPLVTSADGAWVVTANRGKVYVARLDAPAGTPPTELVTSSDEIERLVAAPSTGSVLVVGRGRVHRVTLGATPAISSSLDLPQSATVVDAAFDGRRVAVLQGWSGSVDPSRSRLLAFDFDASTTTEIASSTAGDLAYHATSHGVVYVSEEPSVGGRTVRRILGVPLDGRPTTTVATLAGEWADPRGNIGMFEVSSDGTTAFFTYVPTRREAYGVDAYFVPTDGSLAPTLVTTDLVQAYTQDWHRKGDKLVLAAPSGQGLFGRGWEFDLGRVGSAVSIPVLPRLLLNAGQGVAVSDVSGWIYATVACDADKQYRVDMRSRLGTSGTYLPCFPLAETDLLPVLGTDRVVVARKVRRPDDTSASPDRYRLDVVGPDPR